MVLGLSADLDLESLSHSHRLLYCLVVMNGFCLDQVPVLKSPAPLPMIKKKKIFDFKRLSGFVSVD